MPSQMTSHGYSKLAAFERCPKYYHFSYNLNLQSNKVALAPAFGSIMHKGREAWLANGKSLQHAVDAVKLIIQEFVDEGWSNFTDPTEIEDFTNYCLKGIYEYHMQYKDDKIEYIPEGLEVSFDLPFGNRRLTGRLDGICIISKLVWVDEFKTTGMTAARYLSNMTMDGKCTAYVWAARQAGFKEVQGVHLDVMVKKPRKAGFEFVRDILPKTDEQLIQWERATRELHKRLYYSEVEGYWPEQYHSCSNMFGNCPFIDLCRFGETEQLINAQFVRRKEVTENDDRS
jgi:hypothetical protein